MDPQNQEFVWKFLPPINNSPNEDRSYYQPASSQGSFLPIQLVNSGVSPGSYGPNLPYCLISSNSGWLRHNGNASYNPQFLQKSPHVEFRGVTVPGVVSPEQSITACSIAESSNRAPVRDDTSALSSMPFSNPRLSYEQLPNGLQALTSEQYRLQLPPPRAPAHVEISLGAQTYGCRSTNGTLHNEVPVGMSSKPLGSNEEKRLDRTQAPRKKDPIPFMQKILAWYLKFESNLVGHERRQQEFVNKLHLTLCNVKLCDCTKYCTLISHFDVCRNTRCSICQPARQLGCTKRISSGPQFEPCPQQQEETFDPGPIGKIASNFEVKGRPPKRMKTDNAAEVDDWSLSAVVHASSEPQVGGLVNDEDSKEKTNREPLSSKEVSTAVVTGNVTAGNDGGSMWSENFDGLGQSSESHINSALLNQVPIPTDNHENCLQTYSDVSDLCNIKLRVEDATSHFEDYNSGEQQDTGSVKINKVKSDAAFCCPRSNSEGICVLSQVGDLGKDDAIPLSEECNLVGEQQDIFCNETRKVKFYVSLHPQESPIDEGENFKPVIEPEHNRIDAKYDLANPDNEGGRKSNDLRISGAALTDILAADEIRQHMHSLNQDISLNSCLESSPSMSSDTVGSNTCEICALETIKFTALDMFCTSCEARIKYKMTYYWTNDEVGARYCFCTTCFKNARGGKISCRGISLTKSQLHKDKHTQEHDEAWVECDKCQKRQHQICALYNSERGPKGKADYSCPSCQLKELEAKGLESIPQDYGAQDLPRTKLSDHIEQRLFRSLEKERKQRAELPGKNPEDVTGVSDLKVRVVLNVNRQLRVKQQFLDVLPHETYPAEFPYKSKAILLFQEVEGVDVCLFVMYVEEFGSECGNPNKRSVYISYLDSVKYFRPEIQSAVGVPMRTFVYHEILIGYLDYCKKLGFLTCYIWSCPPLKGEDYILHCHPKTQRKPNPNKLVQWYKKMLKKAMEENVVVGFTNLYDHFFVLKEDSNCKITAARLPYFDGCYWSRAVEDIAQSNELSNKQVKNKLTKRTMKAMGYNDLSTGETKDILVMQQLGQKIMSAKDEFFVIHLHFTCAKCREPILSGSCWSCKQCSNFHLCGRCHDLDLSSNLLETHTVFYGDKHQVYKTQVDDVAADTDDKDGLIENDFFIERQTFLSFCEKNFLRFDTLRRAKHSSMMILYHLHASKETATETISSVSADPRQKCELKRTSVGDSRQENKHHTKPTKRPRSKTIRIINTKWVSSF